MKLSLSLITIALGLSVSFTSLANIEYKKMLDEAQRSEIDLTIDQQRQPAKFMAFMEIKPGMRVLDIFSGSGYYSEVVAAIVGPTGEVTAHNNQAYVDYIGKEKLTKRYANNRLKNVKKLLQEANELSLPEQYYDRALLILSFHDLFYVDEKNGWPKIDAKAFMLKVRQSLKPGGLVGIIEHVAKAGEDISTAQSLHRISPVIIKQKMADWGFKLVGEAGYLRNPQDPKTIPMWDPLVRGKTDRVVLKFAVVGQD